MSGKQYIKQFDEIVAELGSTRPRLLLHSCCGPCSSSVIELLSKHFRVTVLWYNPNLYPEAEFYKRLETQKKLIASLEADSLGSAELTVCDWRSEDYFSRVKGLEDEPEEGKRCLECFRIRLFETAKLAAEKGFDYFCTTLTVSSQKDPDAINAIGSEAAECFGVAWLPSEFRKREGGHRSVELSKKYGLYRQDYCGCVFSLRNRNSES